MRQCKKKEKTKKTVLPRTNNRTKKRPAPLEERFDILEELTSKLVSQQKDCQKRTKLTEETISFLRSKQEVNEERFEVYGEEVEVCKTELDIHAEQLKTCRKELISTRRDVNDLRKKVQDRKTAVLKQEEEFKKMSEEIETAPSRDTKGSEESERSLMETNESESSPKIPLTSGRYNRNIKFAKYFEPCSDG